MESIVQGYRLQYLKARCPLEFKIQNPLTEEPCCQHLGTDTWRTPIHLDLPAFLEKLL